MVMPAAHIATRQDLDECATNKNQTQGNSKRHATFELACGGQGREQGVLRADKKRSRNALTSTNISRRETATNNTKDATSPSVTPITHPFPAGAQEAATPCTPLSQSALDVHERFWNNSHAWGAIESRAATTAAATAFTFRSMGSKSRSTEQRPELFSSQDGRSSDGSPSTMRSCTRASLFSDFPEERSRIMRSQASNSVSVPSSGGGVVSHKPQRLSEVENRFSRSGKETESQEGTTSQGGVGLPGENSGVADGSPGVRLCIPGRPSFRSFGVNGCSQQNTSEIETLDKAESRQPRSCHMSPTEQKTTPALPRSTWRLGGSSPWTGEQPPCQETRAAVVLSDRAPDHREVGGSTDGGYGGLVRVGIEQTLTRAKSSNSNSSDDVMFESSPVRRRASDKQQQQQQQAEHQYQHQHQHQMHQRQQHQRVQHQHQHRQEHQQQQKQHRTRPFIKPVLQKAQLPLELENCLSSSAGVVAANPLFPTHEENSGQSSPSPVPDERCPAGESLEGSNLHVQLREMKKAKAARGPYKCRRCGQPKNNHKCPFKTGSGNINICGVQTTTLKPGTAVDAPDPLAPSEVDKNILQALSYTKALSSYDQPTGPYGNGAMGSRSNGIGQVGSPAAHSGALGRLENNETDLPAERVQSTADRAESGGERKKQPYNYMSSSHGRPTDFYRSCATDGKSSTIYEDSSPGGHCGAPQGLAKNIDSPAYRPQSIVDCGKSESERKSQACMKVVPTNNEPTDSCRSGATISKRNGISEGSSPGVRCGALRGFVNATDLLGQRLQPTADCEGTESGGERRSGGFRMEPGGSFSSPTGGAGGSWSGANLEPPLEMWIDQEGGGSVGVMGHGGENWKPLPQIPPTTGPTGSAPGERRDSFDGGLYLGPPPSLPIDKMTPTPYYRTDVFQWRQELNKSLAAGEVDVVEIWESFCSTGDVKLTPELEELETILFGEVFPCTTEMPTGLLRSSFNESNGDEMSVSRSVYAAGGGGSVGGNAGGPPCPGEEGEPPYNLAKTGKNWQC